jgi:hypothetical protein
LTRYMPTNAGSVLSLACLALERDIRFSDPGNSMYARVVPCFSCCRRGDLETYPKILGDGSKRGAEFVIPNAPRGKANKAAVTKVFIFLKLV